MKTLHKRCAGLDVHKAEVVACLRVVSRGKESYEPAPVSDNHARAD